MHIAFFLCGLGKEGELIARLVVVDLLDEFSEVAKPVASTGAPGGGGAAAGTAAGGDVDDEFAQELQRGMADLLGELESSVIHPTICPVIGMGANMPLLARSPSYNSSLSTSSRSFLTQQLPALPQLPPLPALALLARPHPRPQPQPPPPAPRQARLPSPTP